MTRTALLIVLGLAVGCKTYDRPRELRGKPRPDDPRLPFNAPGVGGIERIERQQELGRGRYAIPEDDFRIGPNGLIDRPSPTGR